MLAGQQMGLSVELLNKKQIFSLFFLCDVVGANRMAWGFHYPAYFFGYQLTQPAARSVPPSHLEHYKDNDCDDNAHQDESRIKSGAENVTDHFTTGHGEEHQNNTQSN